MGWLNTVLDIGIVSMQANHAHKLRKLQQQQADEAVMRAVIEALRNEYFKMRQAAEKILGIEGQNPKMAALAMKSLALKVREFDISPEAFPEISDKEYVAATINLIQDNTERMLNQYSEEEQRSLNEAANSAKKMAKYEYYLNNYDKVEELREANEIYNRHKVFNKGCLAFIIGYFGLAFFATIGWGIIGGIPALLFGGTETGATLSVIIGIPGAIFGIYVYVDKVMNRKEFKSAQKTRERLKEFDLEQFNAVAKELGRSITMVKKNYKKDLAKIEEVLEDPEELHKMLGVGLKPPGPDAIDEAVS
jgi:tetratricopeptide (TPR) repeat protein